MIEERITAASIRYHLANYLYFHKRGAVMSNMFIVGSPWESDVIAVSKTLTYVEYEIKLTVPDFRKDFQKRSSSWQRGAILKHEAYSSPGPIVKPEMPQRFIPKPRQFYFVVPAGLVSQVPEHCGLMEFDPNSNYWKIRETKKAPRLKNPTTLSTHQLHNLLLKAGSKLRAVK